MRNAVRCSWKILLLAAMMLAGRQAMQAGSPDSISAPDRSAEIQPARTRLFFTPEARPLRAGSGYVALADLFFPSLAVGITGFFSVNAGVSLVPGLDRQYVTISPKITPYATDRLALAAGVLYMGRRGEAGTGIIYADVTSDGSAGSGTFGLGWSTAGDGIDGRPVILAGFRVPVSGGFEIVSENWFPPSGGAIRRGAFRSTSPPGCRRCGMTAARPRSSRGYRSRMDFNQE
jgi:hypothetical protein